MICGVLFLSTALLATRALAQDEAKAVPKTQSGGDMGEIGKKLANPLGSVWALNFNSFIPGFYDGNVNLNDSELGATTIFQPVLPVPLRGGYTLLAEKTTVGSCHDKRFGFLRRQLFSAYNLS